MNATGAVRPIRLLPSVHSDVQLSDTAVMQIARSRSRREPSERALQRARDQALAALTGDRAVSWLVESYDPSSPYAGGTFLSVGPVDPFALTATDFYAVSLLSVKVGARAARQLLEIKPALDARLAAIPVDADLTTATDDVFRAAEDFSLSVQHALGGNPWVTASKLCARKRPSFFPVRDRPVTLELLDAGRDYWIDWQIYRELLTAPAVRERLDEVTRSAHDRGALITDPPLRVLDVVLSMYAKHIRPLN